MTLTFDTPQRQDITFDPNSDVEVPDGYADADEQNDQALFAIEYRE